MTCEPPDTCLLLLSLSLSLLLLLLALFLFISMIFFSAPASAGALSYIQAGHSWSCEVCTPGNSGRYSFFLKQITRLQQSCATHHSSAKMAVLSQTFSCGPDSNVLTGFLAQCASVWNFISNGFRSSHPVSIWLCVTVKFLLSEINGNSCSPKKPHTQSCHYICQDCLVHLGDIGTYCKLCCPDTKSSLLSLSLLSSKSPFSQPFKEKMHKWDSENLYYNHLSSE